MENLLVLGVPILKHIMVYYLSSFLSDPEKQDNWSQKSWEDLLLKMLSKSLDVIDHEEWIAELGEAFGSHIPMYNRYPEEKVGIL